ncbi:GNAT family N-acetyltransferase [Caldithrix abyssi]|nr:GNAT family N-acetyltransferase [Caldithrix abyssi]
MKIRYAEKNDIEQIVNLCKEHATYEKSKFNSKNKLELLSNYLFSTKEILKCIVVEKNNQIVGYATFMKQFSTWEANFYVYLDCLFLKEEARGKGVGREMMNQIQEYAKTENCETLHIQWQTPSFNKDAIAFYERIGAKPKTKERFFWKV